MAGKVLRCDHPGCEEMFPKRPRRGWHWDIRRAAERAGWSSSVSSPFNRPGRGQEIVDWCPVHSIPTVFIPLWIDPDGSSAEDQARD